MLPQNQAVPGELRFRCPHSHPLRPLHHPGSLFLPRANTCGGMRVRCHQICLNPLSCGHSSPSGFLYQGPPPRRPPKRGLSSAVTSPLAASSGDSAKFPSPGAWLEVMLIFLLLFLVPLFLFLVIPNPFLIRQKTS